MWLCHGQNLKFPTSEVLVSSWHIKDKSLENRWEGGGGGNGANIQPARIFFTSTVSAGFFAGQALASCTKVFRVRRGNGNSEGGNILRSTAAILILIFRAIWMSALTWAGFKFKQIFFNFHTVVLLSCQNYTRAKHNQVSYLSSIA